MLSRVIKEEADVGLRGDGRRTGPLLTPAPSPTVLLPARSPDFSGGGKAGGPAVRLRLSPLLRNRPASRQKPKPAGPA